MKLNPRHETNRRTHRRLQSLIFSLAALLAVQSHSNFAEALDLGDSEWEGCPQRNIAGLWNARSHSVTAPKSIWFQEEAVTLVFPTDEKKTFAFDRSSASGPFVELILTEPEALQAQPGVLRIRPHAVFPPAPSGPQAAPVCLIKVFRFASPSQAKFGKYRDWNIYENGGS